MTIPALMPVYPRCEVEAVRGEGAYLFDGKGNRWLDFSSGIAVNALGHCHPHLVAAIQKQAATLMHVSNLYRIPAQEHLAARLVDLTFADTLFFTNSGAEAIECAIKTAFRYHYVRGEAHRHRLLTFSHAFHGRTFGAIAATDQAKMREGFEPLPDWFTILPFGDLEAAAAAIGDDFAGFLVEPIQGEGGVRVPGDDFLPGLRALADQHGGLLVLDEVQTGVGRTGTLFAHEQFGVTPDIMAIAKGIGGGFPLGACLATERAAEGMGFGVHGSTYGGNPLAMAAGEAMLDIIARDDFLAGVRDVAARLHAALDEIARANDDIFKGVRGRGLLLGLMCKLPSRSFVALARRHGLLLVPAADDVVRVLPPLILEDGHIAEFVEKMGHITQAARAGEA